MIPEVSCLLKAPVLFYMCVCVYKCICLCINDSTCLCFERGVLSDVAFSLYIGFSLEIVLFPKGKSHHRTRIALTDTRTS